MYDADEFTLSPEISADLRALHEKYGGRLDTLADASIRLGLPETPERVFPDEASLRPDTAQ
jgi:hypothetical protein